MSQSVSAASLSNEGVGGAQQGAWFSGLRSKLATFSMSDWWSQLGARRPAAIDARAASAGPMLLDDDWLPSPIDESDSGGRTPITMATPTAEQGESWELPNFWLNLEPGRNYHDTFEIQHFGPLDGLVPLGKKELGAGHDFVSVQLLNPTWCDKCGDFIWGFFKQAVTCSNCNYTCHYKCRMLVTLDCLSLSDSIKTQSTIPDAPYLTAKSAIIPQFDDGPDDQFIWSEKDLEQNELDSVAEQLDIDSDPLAFLEILGSQITREHLEQLISDYNCTAHGLGIALDPEGVRYSGYLRIHMNFSRPINVVAGQRPPSVYDVMGNGVMTMASDIEGNRTITSFFLPRNTVKIVHLDSSTTARQLIITLLRKFKVADNPCKFALYERSFNEGEKTLVAKLKRIPDEAYPLRIALQWGGESDKRFVLQENESGEIQWNAFEIPELVNFIKILEIEEQQYVFQIKQRYSLQRHYIHLEMKERKMEQVRENNANSNANQLEIDPFGTGTNDLFGGDFSQDNMDPWIRRESDFATMRPNDSANRHSNNSMGTM